MNRFLLLVAAATLGVFAAGVACASPVTFFGQDQHPSSSTANSNDAHTQFMAHLASGVGTQDFESFSPGFYSSLSVSFPGSTGLIGATVTGSGDEIYSGLNGVGGYPISGNQYLESFEDFNLAFSSPISAFGFYGTDIGDVGGDLVLTLTLSDGSTVTITVPTDGSASGNQLFWGFFDPTESVTNIAFSNTAGGDDLFGFDDMTIGDLQQVIVNPVPEPGNLAMLGLALLGMIPLLLLRRRRVSIRA